MTQSKASPSSLTRRVASSKRSSMPIRSVRYPNRALRVARLFFYSLAAPTFLYAFYVQIVVLKGPGRTPLPASVGFGRDTLFLTFHANFHCTWYACMCLLNAFLAFGKRRRPSKAARSCERAAHNFTSVLFPLSAFVGLGYYLILHFHPLNRMRARLVPDHDQKMALLHLNPLLFVVIDSLLKDSELFIKHTVPQPRAVRIISLYGLFYFLWTLFCTRFNGGYWPYPFQTSFSPIQHCMFVAFCIISSVYLTRAGFRMHARIDRRRRRRLAMAERTSKL